HQVADLVIGSDVFVPGLNRCLIRLFDISSANEHQSNQFSAFLAAQRVKVVKELPPLRVVNNFVDGSTCAVSSPGLSRLGHPLEQGHYFFELGLSKNHRFPTASCVCGPMIVKKMAQVCKGIMRPYALSADCLPTRNPDCSLRFRKARVRHISIELGVKVSPL